MRMRDWARALGIAVIAAAAAAPLQAVAADTPHSPVDFPAYENVQGLEEYATPDVYAHALADKRFVMEKLSYVSDGLTVYAYLYRPVVAPTSKMPVIVFNRGSWTRPSFHAEMLPMAERLADSGFLVIAPMYRGSGGAPGRDELGGVDLDDLFNLLPLIKAIPYADSSQLFLYGESRGGMMVVQALRDGFPARAAATYGAFTDLDAMLQNPYWLKAGTQIWGDELDKNRNALVERRSAMRWADRLNAPLLLMQGAQDHAVDPSQSLRLAGELHRLNKPFELVLMDGEDHMLTGRAAERDRLTVEWFKKHMVLAPR